MKKNKQKNKVPFFTQLLTKQEMQHVAAGKGTSPLKDQPDETMKWPSDGDESTPVNDSVDS